MGQDVAGGGGTSFTDLDLQVKPTRGAALVWPSLSDADPNVPELRTHHEALPVTKGTKYAANFWVHLRNFQTPHAMRCGTDVVQSATASAHLVAWSHRATAQQVASAYYSTQITVHRQFI